MLIFYWQSPNSWRSFTAHQCKLASDLIRSGKVPKYEAPNQSGAYLMRCVNLRCKISCLSNRVTFGSGTSSCLRCIPFLWHRVSYVCLHELNPCQNEPKQWFCCDYSLVCCSRTGMRRELVFFIHFKSFVSLFLHLPSAKQNPHCYSLHVSSHCMCSRSPNS